MMILASKETIRVTRNLFQSSLTVVYSLATDCCSIA